MSAPDRRAMLSTGSTSRCRFGGNARLSAWRAGAFYRARKPANDNDGALMRRIDELFTAWPFLGLRRMTAMLRAEGVNVNRKRVQRLMRLMGIAALRPKPKTSKPAPGHRIYPYLLRIWRSSGRTTSGRPTSRTFRSGGAFSIWWRSSTGRRARFWRGGCRTRWRSRSSARLEEARAKFGKPEIFNTDQGSQFTSAAFTGALAEAGVAISMDGRGRWMDNVFIERLGRSLKYEDVYLKGYADGGEAARGIAAWIAFYNERRPHQALADRTPMAVRREATAGVEAVDMMDNASALPTFPQQQKQTQFLAA